MNGTSGGKQNGKLNDGLFYQMMHVLFFYMRNAYSAVLSVDSAGTLDCIVSKVLYIIQWQIVY